MNLTMEPSPHKIPVPNSAPTLPRSSQNKNNKNQHKRSHSKIYPPSPSITVKFPTDISSSCSGSIPSQHYPQYYYNYPHHCPNPDHHFRHMSGFQVQQFAANSNNKDHFNRKRQRKHAAAATIVPDSIWNSNINNNNMGRKSTAQPRPVLHIPPRGIGPIVEPNENDVLCGRGGRINSHSGNVKFRDIINSRKKEYLAPSTKKLEKAHIAAGIVNDIRSMDPPGRFLKEDRGTGLWFDIGDAKAIKKTGQALREDAPDIRHELEGDDSSGDERGGALSPKVQGNKSPKTSPKISQSPKQMPPAAATSFPPPGLPVWPQVGNVITPQPSSLEYQAQMAMPPPSHNYSSSQQQSQQGNGSFETRNIPIPVPRSQPPMLANNFYQLPNQLYSGARSVTSKMTLASKHAIAALSPVNSNNNGQTQSPPDDIAFGRPFHSPEAAQTVLSSDHTMSTISGLSENLSSNMSGGEFRPSALMNMSLKSSGIVNNSLRLSSLHGFRTSNFGSGNNTSGGDSSMGLSGLSAINSLRGGGSGGGGGFHGESSLQRSLSMSSIMDGDHWRAIMEADDELLDETAAKSILSGGGTSAKHSLSSANSINRQRNSSAMSIGGLSMGGLSIGGLSMDLQSNASSTQWLAAVGLGGATLQSDDRTYMSNMSTELNALDLAGAGSSYRI